MADRQTESQADIQIDYLTKHMWTPTSNSLGFHSFVKPCHYRLVSPVPQTLSRCFTWQLIEMKYNASDECNWFNEP